jgi:rhomboid-like protein
MNVFVQTHGRYFFLSNAGPQLARAAQSNGLSRFFSRNASVGKMMKDNWLIWNRIPRKTKPLDTLKSMMFPFGGARRNMATHRDLGGSYGGAGGGGKWRQKFRWTWYIYKQPILFGTGVLAFNTFALPYLFQMPFMTPLKRHPREVVYGLIGINLAVFLMWQSRNARLLKYVTRYGLLYKDSNFNKWGMLGSAFSHQGFMHLFLNMFVLWNMGLPVAQMLGTGKFLEVYFDGAIMSSLLSILSPMMTGYRQLIPSLGASGAIFTIFGLLTYLQPNVQLAFMGIPIPMSGWAVFMSSFGVNVAGMYFRWGAIDYAGHVGGSIVAIIWGSIIQKRIERLRQRRSSWNW